MNSSGEISLEKIHKAKKEEKLRDGVFIIRDGIQKAPYCRNPSNNRISP